MPTGHDTPDDRNFEWGYVESTPDWRQTRNREQSTALQLGRLGGFGPSRGDSFAGVTTTMTKYPTTAKAYYAIQPVDVGGTEAEGTAYTTANVGGPIVAINLGSQIPPNGTQVRVDPAGGRFVFAYFGG